MSFQSITKYLLSDQDYKAGIELLNKYSDNSFLKKMLGKGETPYNRKKLIEELRRIEQATAKGSAYKVTFGKEYDGLPDEVKELKAKCDAAFKEMRDLHSRLLHFKDKDRAEAAFRILELEAICVPAWADLSHFKRTGKLPKHEKVVPKVKGDTRDGLLRRYYTVRTYISKGLIKYKDELNEIERKLAEN